MNKYMLFAVACIISQGLSAQVALDIKVKDHIQTVLLEEDQQQICVFDDARVVIRNIKEDVDSVLIEIAVDKDGVISSDEVSIDFEHEASVCGVEISAIKK